MGGPMVTEKQGLGGLSPLGRLRLGSGTTTFQLGNLAKPVPVCKIGIVTAPPAGAGEDYRDDTGGRKAQRGQQDTGSQEGIVGSPRLLSTPLRPLLASRGVAAWDWLHWPLQIPPQRLCLRWPLPFTKQASSKVAILSFLPASSFEGPGLLSPQQDCWTLGGQYAGSCFSSLYHNQSYSGWRLLPPLCTLSPVTPTPCPSGHALLGRIPRSGGSQHPHPQSPHQPRAAHPTKPDC